MNHAKVQQPHSSKTLIIVLTLLIISVIVALIVYGMYIDLEQMKENNENQRLLKEKEKEIEQIKLEKMKAQNEKERILKEKKESELEHEMQMKEEQHAFEKSQQKIQAQKQLYEQEITQKHERQMKKMKLQEKHMDAKKELFLKASQPVITSTTTYEKGWLGSGTTTTKQHVEYPLKSQLNYMIEQIEKETVDNDNDTAQNKTFSPD